MRKRVEESEQDKRDGYMYTCLFQFKYIMKLLVLTNQYR
jgi:hypothetical protein